MNPKAPAFRDIDPPAVMPDTSASWRCHPVNARFVERFLDLAGSHGAAVFWLMPPLPPGHQALYDRGRAEENYLGYVRRVAGRRARVTVVDGRHAGFPASAFIDIVHLDRTGAAALSESLAPLLAGGPLPGWVELAGFRATPGEPGVEDVLQSALALGDRARGSARR